jgi:phosphate/sulfate permease
MEFILFFFLFLVCAFEFINGFHDTANAVAPVIYTNSLSPKKSVIIAAFFNFLGVAIGGTAVAMGIIHLLPVEHIISGGYWFWLAIITALLASSIIWNLGTWWLGIPASSSHTLIGSIIGVTIVIWILGGEVPHWAKAYEILKSLLISPIIGFGLAFGGMWIIHHVTKDTSIFWHPGILTNRHPKFGIKYALIATSAFVSYAHGSNDGQKGVGLMMLILVILVPHQFSVEVIPWWVIATISLSLGLGTMIGWRRIVVTLWEKIWKHKLSYAQATVASLMTAITITLASKFWLPVSTTHIMSSGVAGTMWFEYGKNWLDINTMKHIMMAWVLTFPITVLMSGTIFYGIAKIFL